MYANSIVIFGGMSIINYLCAVFFKKLICMAVLRDNKWQENYCQLRQYIEIHRQLPDKKKVENRRLLNWWKYNKKCIKQGRLNDEKIRLLQKLSDMRLPSGRPQEQPKPLT